MVTCKHISNSLIIIVEYTVLRDYMLVLKRESFLNLEIEGNSKIVIDCYNKIINILNYILSLMKYI